MLYICSWLWGEKWGPQYAERLFAGLRRNINQNYRTVLISDRNNPRGADILYQIDAEPLLAERGCLVRMRMFDAAWQSRIGVKPGDRIVNIDLDAVVTGELDPLFDRDDEFTIMQGFNSTNPCPFNGSLWMFRAGERHDVWDDFSIEASARVPYHAFPDDQGWLHYKFPKAKAYTPDDGVYCFKKKTWATGFELPANARIVAFPGRDPAKYIETDWVRENWR